MFFCVSGDSRSCAFDDEEDVVLIDALSEFKFLLREELEELSFENGFSGIVALVLSCLVTR